MKHVHKDVVVAAANAANAGPSAMTGKINKNLFAPIRTSDFSEFDSHQSLIYLYNRISVEEKWKGG